MLTQKDLILIQKALEPQFQNIQNQFNRRFDSLDKKFIKLFNFLDKEVCTLQKRCDRTDKYLGLSPLV